jgi:hypothetical protein
MFALECSDQSTASTENAQSLANSPDSKHQQMAHREETRRDEVSLNL